MLFGGDYYSEIMDKWFNVSEKLIKWHDGRTIRLCTLNDISEKINYERVIEKQVFYDNLTGLPNRLSLDKSIQGIIESDENSTVMLIDLDNFKNINDSYGHNNGDRLLKEIGKFFENFAWKNKKLSVFRFGSDEFVVLLRDQDQAEIDEICKIIHDKFNTEWQIANSSCYCTCSMGVAKFPKPDDTVNTVLKRIDLAISYAKKQGIAGIMDVIIYAFSDYRDYNYYAADHVSDDEVGTIYERRISTLKEWLDSGKETFTQVEKDFMIQKYEELKTPFYYEYMDGWAALLQNISTFILMLALVIGFLVSGIFSDEFQSKADSIFFSARFGRSRGISAKLISDSSWA